MTETKKPNVIILYADDLGFGDVSCYGATDIATPNIDALAKGGVKFQQGYATAATCTPSRYSLMTGSYPWRNERAAVLRGNDPLIIDTECRTMPKRFAAGGYHTGIVGKWHLGLGDGEMDWNKTVDKCPNAVGFDYSFIMAATNDRTPCVYLENGDVVNLDSNDPIEVNYNFDEPFPNEPTYEKNPELLEMKSSHGHNFSVVNGVGRIGYMRGGKAAIWDDRTMAETFLGKAQDYITSHKDAPFFLYYALHQPHVPRIPSKQFEGASKLGPRGDVILEMDWCVGQLMETLKEQGLLEDTIVIFSSDNGPVLDDGYVDSAPEKNGEHSPTGPLRGGKYSRFDGGTRVPFILSWEGSVAAGTSDALVSHVDFHASFARLIGEELKDNEAPDSIDILDALLGESQTGRDELVVEGLRANTIIRNGAWVYMPPKDGPEVFTNTNTESGLSGEPQLYNLDDDIGQIKNVATREEPRVRQMDERLQEIIAAARTR